MLSVVLGLFFDDVVCNLLCNWKHKDCDVYSPVCGMVHIKDPLLVTCKCSP